MAIPTYFTDQELLDIRSKLAADLNRKIGWSVVFLAPMSLVTPLIPGRRGTSLMESLGYGQAIILMVLIFFVAGIYAWIKNHRKLQQDFDAMRPLLRKSVLETTILAKKKAFLQREDHLLETDLKGDFRVLDVEPATASQFAVGSRVQVIVEVHTKTLLHLLPPCP